MAGGTVTLGGASISFRGRIIAASVYNEAMSRMASLYREVEAGRGVLIPNAIRLFLSDTVIESLYLHHDAWLQRLSLDPGQDSYSGSIGDVIHKSLVEVLTNAEAEPWAPNGAPQITLIGILAYIHANWCGIFPICR